MNKSDELTGKVDVKKGLIYSKEDKGPYASAANERYKLIKTFKSKYIKGDIYVYERIKTEELHHNAIGIPIRLPRKSDGGHRERRKVSVEDTNKY